MRLLLSLVIALATCSAAAADRKSLAVGAITSQQAEIRAGVVAGSGRYKDMPARTREELLSRQAKVLVSLDGKVSVDELGERDRLQVFNDLEWIEAAINNAEDERMVCKHEKTLGSNRSQRVCKTVAQIREEKENARRDINRGCPAGICSF